MVGNERKWAIWMIMWHWGGGATEGITLVEFAAFIFNWIFMERLRVGRGVASEGGICG